MSSFLEKILLTTRFTTNGTKAEFLPRKVGLGYELTAEKAEKSILKPVFKEIRRRERQEENRQLKAADSSSEEVSKMAHIAKKSKK